VLGATSKSPRSALLRWTVGRLPFGDEVAEGALVRLLVAGCPVHLTADTPRGLEDLRSALAEAPLAPATGEGPEFVLRSQEGSVPLPSRAPDRQLQHIHVWQHGQSRDACAPTVVSIGGYTAAVSEGSAVLDPAGDGVRAMHALLLPVLSLLFAQRAACVVHGAGVRTRGDRVRTHRDRVRTSDDVTLILGGSGRGKSTLVAAAISAGLPVLSDDLLVLRLRDDRLTVAGVPQPLALPADQAHHPAVGETLPGDHRDRRAAAPGWRPETGEFPVGRVVLVEHSEAADGHLVSCAASDVLRWVLVSTLEGLAPQTAHRGFTYASAAARLPGWRLGHAADAARRVPLAAARLLEVSRVPARES
jgi:hypothetical protein